MKKENSINLIKTNGLKEHFRLYHSSSSPWTANMLKLVSCKRSKRSPFLKHSETILTLTSLCSEVLSHLWSSHPCNWYTGNQLMHQSFTDTRLPLFPVSPEDTSDTPLGSCKSCLHSLLSLLPPYFPKPGKFSTSVIRKDLGKSLYCLGLSYRTAIAKPIKHTLLCTCSCLWEQAHIC